MGDEVNQTVLRDESNQRVVKERESCVRCTSEHHGVCHEGVSIDQSLSLRTNADEQPSTLLLLQGTATPPPHRDRGGDKRKHYIRRVDTLHIRHTLHL